MPVNIGNLTPVNLIIILLFLLLFIFISLPNRVEEPFAYLKNPETGKFEAVEQLKYRLPKDVLLDTPIQDYYYCKEVCETSEHCNAFDYALNRCTTIKNAKKVPTISWLYAQF